MIRYFLFYLFVVIVTTGCKQDKTVEKHPVQIKKYRRGEILNKTSTDLTIRINKPYISLAFGLEKTEFGETIIDPFVEINTTDKSKINFQGMTIYLIDEKKFQIKNIDYNVKKYYYNVPDISDDEAYVYIVNQRLICVSSNLLSTFTMYKYDNLNFVELLINDKSGFFDRHK